MTTIFKLEPNFTPGEYDIYFGLFVGDTRIEGEERSERRRQSRARGTAARSVARAARP